MKKKIIFLFTYILLLGGAPVLVYNFWPKAQDEIEYSDGYEGSLPDETGSGTDSLAQANSAQTAYNTMTENLNKTAYNMARAIRAAIAAGICVLLSAFVSLFLSIVKCFFPNSKTSEAALPIFIFTVLYLPVCVLVLQLVAPYFIFTVLVVFVYLLFALLAFLLLLLLSLIFLLIGFVRRKNVVK